MAVKNGAAEVSQRWSDSQLIVQGLAAADIDDKPPA